MRKALRPLLRPVLAATACSLATLATLMATLPAAQAADKIKVGLVTTLSGPDGAPGIDGGVIEAGASAATADGDLVIIHGPAGLAAREAAEGTITPDEPIALLRGARPYLPVVQALLDRCAAAETRS